MAGALANDYAKSMAQTGSLLNDFMVNENVRVDCGQRIRGFTGQLS